MTEQSETSGAVHDTSEPFSAVDGPRYSTEDIAVANQEFERLGEYLTTNFPDEVDRTNAVHPETAVDVAIRLLTRLSAHQHPTQAKRCPEGFCNKPLGHTDAHGWVNFG